VAARSSQALRLALLIVQPATSLAQSLLRGRAFSIGIAAIPALLPKNKPPWPFSTSCTSWARGRGTGILGRLGPRTRRVAGLPAGVRGASGRPRAGLGR